MAEIINFTWCENNGFEKPGMNVASDTSYCLSTEDGKWYVVVYTESTMGMRKLSVINHKAKKDITCEMPKFNFENNELNFFTTDDLHLMCKLVGIKYPVEEIEHTIKDND